MALVALDLGHNLRAEFVGQPPGTARRKEQRPRKGENSPVATSELLCIAHTHTHTHTWVGGILKVAKATNRYILIHIHKHKTTREKRMVVAVKLLLLASRTRTPKHHDAPTSSP